jgi:hypothetical protein
MTPSVLPTTDLYFLNSCREWVKRWWHSGPIERLGANCFRSGDRLLLIRRDEPRLMEAALRFSGTLIYLIDDDVDGAAASSGLPVAYREKLGMFARSHFDGLLRRSDLLVASSDALADRLQADPRVGAAVSRIDPFWGMPFADQSHFVRLRKGNLDIVHLGTASHDGGLAKATHAVLALLDRFERASFTFFAVRDAHPILERHPRTRRLKPMPWSRYRQWLPHQRFHLALYPLEASAFDQARSSNKLFEHAIVGAVGVYPSGFRPVAILGQGAICAPDDPAHWATKLIEAAEQPADLANRAAVAAAVLHALDTGAAPRREWSHLLTPGQ